MPFVTLRVSEAVSCDSFITSDDSDAVIRVICLVICRTCICVCLNCILCS